MTPRRNPAPWALALLCSFFLTVAGCCLCRSDSEPVAAGEACACAAAEGAAPCDACQGCQEEGAAFAVEEGGEATAEEIATEEAVEEMAGEAVPPQDESEVAETEASVEEAAAERIDELLAQAAEAEAAGDLREAQSIYARAIEADPGSEPAKLGFQRVDASLGAVSGDDVEEVAGAATEMNEVRRAQLRIEAESRVKQGEAALNAGDFDKAIRLFEEALTMVQWNPYLVGDATTEASLRARVDSAKRARTEHERAVEQSRQARILREKQEREDMERARLENRVVTLYAAANRAFQDDRFSEAEGYLTEVLRIDPSNRDAEHFRKLAREARRSAHDRDLNRSYKVNWRKNFDEMAAELRPQNDLLVFPEERLWREIASQGPLEFSVQDELMSADEREILGKLSGVRMQLDFSDTSLSEAVDWFRTVTGVNFIVSPTIIEAGDEPVFTVKAGEMPALEALKLLLSISDAPLSYRVSDGVVRILSAEEAVGGQILEIYDIRDLAKVITNFPSRDFNLTPSDFSAEDFGDEGGEPQPLVLEAERLADLVRTNIAPESWELDPNNTIQAVSGALVVRQKREVHELIRTLLQDLRENAGTLINIEARFLTVSDNFLEDIGVDFRGLGPDAVNPDAAIPAGLVLDEFGAVPEGHGTPSAPSGIGTDNDLGIFHDDGDDGDIRARVENLYDVTLGNDEFTNSGGLSVQATFLDDTLVEAILRAVSKYGTTNVVDAPSLTVFNGQRASLSVINHVSYVKDFNVEIAQAAVIAQPIVDVIQDGVVLDVRPVVSSDKRFITMELRPTVALLQRPIDTFTTSLAIGSDVTIELPVLRIQRARTTVTMPDGSTLMIGGWKVNEDRDLESGVPFLSKVPILSFFFTRKGKFLSKEKLIILVRARIIIPEEGEPAFGLGR
ncbi:MAG: hypothetical protein HY812_08225 [Planctomycetes bacterium]|nr:hypothetical protein [Planctomycetota bacterium]